MIVAILFILIGPTSALGLYRAGARQPLCRGRPLDRTADYYAQAFAKQPFGNSFDWALYAPLLLLTGDGLGYRRHCSQMLHQFGDTPNPESAFEVINKATLGLTEPGEVARCLQMAQLIVAPEPKADWRTVKLAQVLYRAGRFKEALRPLYQSSNMVEVWPLRALVLHRLGQAEPARQWLAKADGWSKRAIQEALARDSLLLPLNPWWWDWAAFGPR